MTPRDLATWSALYAAAWFHCTSAAWVGHVSDLDRARSAAHQADRALEALRAIRPEGE